MNEKVPFFRRKAVRIIFIISATLLVAGGVGIYTVYQRILLPNVSVNGEGASVYIRRGDNLDSLLSELDTLHVLRNPSSFEWWAHKQSLDSKMQRGHYTIEPGMSNRAIVNLFASGRQTPVDLTFNNIRTRQDFAKRIAQQMDLSEGEITAYFDTTSQFLQYGLTKENFMTLFIPNTYEIYWTDPINKFIERMKREHDIFWNAGRLNLAKEIGLTPEEVYILASIVYSENEKASDEAPRIAGVYMNRLQKHMRLEADPTVKFAIGNFAIKRVLYEDLRIDSPYNTYRYEGLPPGPIHMPPITYIDAVLNYEHHDYYYLCARGDGSGYHYFAKTLAEHNRNVVLYHSALDKMGIKR